jgi:hypothetical protein
MKKWTFSADITCDEAIHPEDAAAAYLTRIFSAAGCKRGSTKLKRVVYDLFLDSLVNNRPWSAEQIKCLGALSADKDFCERLARGFEEGRKPTLDKVDVFILRNWRTIRDAKEIMHLVPGLRHWHPAAAGGLLAEYDEKLSGSEEWFKQRARRLVRCILENGYALAMIARWHSNV